MSRMSNIGESMAKKPAIPLLVVLIVTVASLGIIAVSPPSFDMNEDSFSPDNDVTKASLAVSEAFTSTSSVMNTIDASGTAGKNIFTQDVFIDTLRYEQRLYAMEYTDKDGNKLPYYTGIGNDNGFTVMSPVSAVAGAMAKMAGFSNPTYDDMITVISGATDQQIQYAAYNALKSDEGAAMVSLLTNDVKFDDSTMSVSAKGSIIMIIVIDTLVSEEIADGALGFEKDVVAAVDSFSSLILTNGFVIDTVNTVTMMTEIGDMAMDDLSNLIPVALILIVVILLIMYRDIVDTLVGLLGLILAIIWTFGISTAIGIEMTTIAIAVPILLLGLGIDYGLHLVFRYREERMEGNDSAKAGGKTVDSVGEALVLATVTTAIAFLSYLTSSMSALADFGAMCAIGIVCAFIVMLLLIPAMQSIRDRRAEKAGVEMEDLRRYKKSESQHGDVIGKVAGIGGRLSAKSPWLVLGVACIALCGFGYAATNMSYEFDMYSFIPDGTEASDKLNYLDENYSMTTSTTSVMIYADGWNLETMKAIEKTIDDLNTNPVEGLSYLNGSGLEDPQYINLILGAAAVAENNVTGPYTTAYVQVFGTDGKILETAQQSHVETLKTQFWLLVSSSVAYSQLAQGMDQVVGEYDGDTVTRIVLNMTPEAAEGGDPAIALMKDVNAVCDKYFIDINAVTTGSAIVMAVTLEEMNDSQMSSLLLTIILVLIILTLAMYYTDRSWWLGLMSTIPTIVSVVLVWGTMALLGIPLNVLTLTIASLTVGMGVTYGIHISHRFVTELRDNGTNAREAIMIATRETGKGVFGAALTTAVGFGVIGLSAILPMQQFGIITALAIAFGYIGATFLLPALLVVWGEHTTPKDKPVKPAETEA